MTFGIKQVTASAAAALALALFASACERTPDTPTLAPTEAPPATTMPIPTEEPLPTATAEPTQPPPTNTPTPAPTPSATPTATPSPTPSPPTSISIKDIQATQWTRNPDGSWTAQIQLTHHIPYHLRGEGFILQVNGCGDEQCIRNEGQEFIPNDDGSLTMLGILDMQGNRKELEFKVDLRWPTALGDFSDSAVFVAVPPRLPDASDSDIEVPVHRYNADGTTEVGINLPLHGFSDVPFNGAFNIRCAADSDCNLSAAIDGAFTNESDIAVKLPAGSYEIDYSLEIAAYSNGLPLVLAFESTAFDVAQPRLPEFVDPGHLGNLIAYNDDGSAQVMLPFVVKSLGQWVDAGDTVAIWLTCDGAPCEFGSESPMRYQLTEIEDSGGATGSLAPDKLHISGDIVRGALWLPKVPSGEYQINAELLYSLELGAVQSPEVRFAVQPPAPLTSYQPEFSILGYNNDGSATVNVNGRLISVEPGQEGMALDSRLDATLLRFEDIGNFNVPQGTTPVTFGNHDGDEITFQVNIPPASFTVGPYPLVPETVARADFHSIYDALRSNNRWYDPYIALGGLNISWYCTNDDGERSRVRHLKNAAALVTGTVSGEPYILLNDYVVRRQWAYHGNSVWHRSEGEEGTEWHVPAAVVGHHGNQIPAAEMLALVSADLSSIFSNKPGAGPGVPYNMTTYEWGPWYSDSSEIRYVLHVKEIELRNGEIVEAHFHFRPERFEIVALNIIRQAQLADYGACEILTDFSEIRPAAGAPPLELGGNRGLIPAVSRH